MENREWKAGSSSWGTENAGSVEWSLLATLCPTSHKDGVSWYLGIPGVHYCSPPVPSPLLSYCTLSMDCLPWGAPCGNELSEESLSLVMVGNLLWLKQFHGSEWAGSANTAEFFSCHGLTFQIIASSPSCRSPTSVSFLWKAVVVYPRLLSFEN